MKRTFSVGVLIFLLVSCNLKAETITVSGDVFGTWSADTVLVAGEVRVPQEQTLTIEPGVLVLYQVNCLFIVDSAATLYAVGTETDSIVFNKYYQNFDGDGIWFIHASDVSHLVYCKILNQTCWYNPGDENGAGVYCEYSSPTIEHCTFFHCNAEDKGGAIYCHYSSPIISDCVIDSCTAIWGGGGIYLYYSDALIANNQISRNESYSDFYEYEGGGGIHCSYSNPEIINNVIEQNIARIRGGGIYCYCSNPTILGNTVSANCAGIEWGGIFEGGGGIYCHTSNAMISGNTIQHNYTDTWWSVGGGIFFLYGSGTANNNYIIQNHSARGGGIGCHESNALILGNIVIDNYVSSYGGGIYCNSESPTIEGNIIHYNQGNGGGGIYCLLGADPQINKNIISRNQAPFWPGGGISVSDTSNPLIQGNTIIHNVSYHPGGGISCYIDSNPEIIDNTIVGNESDSSGGIFCNDNSNPLIRNNTISNNVGSLFSVGFHCENSSPDFINGILWGNGLEEVLLLGNSNPQIVYSDINGSWPGIGNISEDPMFVNPGLNDYRLQWGSPCIDAGDPDPQYNDPDSTRADMGAFYHDQSMPVRVLLSPHEIPYLIEPEGGTMDYNIQVTNIYQSSHDVTIWCDVTMPDSSVYGPVLGPITITLESGQTVERIRTQTIPAAAPMGVYHYNAYAVVESDTSKDSFMFGKLGSVADGSNSWGNAGDPLVEIPNKGDSRIAPTQLVLHGVYPNPFNPSTVIRYQLPEASLVSLTIYDISGRQVTELINGWRDAGVHDVTFDASTLPSGVYLARLNAGDFSAAQKMVLVK